VGSFEDQHLGIAHEGRASAIFCHCPPERLVPFLEPAAEHGVDLLRQLLDDGARAPVLDRALDPGAGLERGTQPIPTFSLAVH